MADIISFYAATRRLKRPALSESAAVGPAQLLFFTGVRYERPIIDIQMENRKKPRKRKVITVSTDAAIGS
ncbi:hypothetical protein [Agrobacterium rubi]|uniref:Uncharacterized protein n=2 Tax=Agrobacterium rubi TaxID=28099 RepID=A0AAE7R9D2_9HYPH|nr:hypothetical protein [Agrobacterium rubi]MBP1879885.1 hypothetical protein [Agrobacterium rubi]MCL6654034.1 hypothetical protein [Agrobacterium rubi]NTE85752.1 hypothetical protein [Agrobacterium rubi]NTF01684.1 hypothetical protein [Agrobacterium rubi]NTF35927.1 hypothetical protein [Agrobacterium rubi]